jgi:hypothetical protein
VYYVFTAIEVIRQIGNDEKVIDVHYIVTCMARPLLGNGPVNTPRPNTHKATIEESPFLGNDP